MAQQPYQAAAQLAARQRREASGRLLAFGLVLAMVLALAFFLAEGVDQLGGILIGGLSL